MKSPRMKIYAMYSASYELLLNDFFLPSLKNTDLEIVTRKIDSVGSGIFGSECWSQTMLKKVNFIIEAVQENFGHIFIVSDVDVQFFRNISQDIVSRLENKDIVFQSDDYLWRINAWFFACRGNEVMLYFWEEVKKRLEKSIVSGEIHIFAEQHCIRDILAKQPRNIRYGILPVDEYCSPRMEYIPNKKIFLSETLRMYHTTWTSGIENKKYHWEQVRSLVQRNFLLKMSHFYVGYYATVLVHIKFFVVREGAIFWQKYQNLYKRILSTFSSNIFIFMNKGLQVVQQIYFCILYSIKKRDYSCYPFIGDIIWHRHHDINLPEKPVIFHSSKNGFFSIFIEVLGYLDYCEKRGYSPKILLDTGYYLETWKGPNWWEYYFEQVLMKGNENYSNISDQKGISESMPSEYENIFWDYSRSYISLNRKNAIFRKYIKIHDTISEEAHKFVRDEFRDFYIVGCHIRGTDKRTEIRRKYSIESVTKKLNKILRNKSNYKIFLATDDQEYYLKMKEIYKDRIISRDCSRFQGEILTNEKYRGYVIGEEILLDGLILSKCDYFIGGSSNVSHAVLILNPNIQHTIIKFNC